LASPWVRIILDAAGFDQLQFQSVDEPIEFGADTDDSWGFMRSLGIVRGLTHDLDDEAKARTLDNLHAEVVTHDTAYGVLFGASAWLITARRS
jgi:hypothetical protein